MKPLITVNGIEKSKNSVFYDFTYSEDLKDCFNPKEKFFIKYGIDGSEDLNVASIPESILIVPFLCNVLPISWVLDAEIRVKEVDESFYVNIPNFKNGYIKMYPDVDFKGNMIAGKIVKNKYNADETKSKLAFFSGGVDAFNTLVNHSNEKPTLITLWGSDIFFNDIKGWNNVRRHIEKTAVQFGLRYCYVKSNFRSFLREDTLSKLVEKRAGDAWWHGFQHGIGLIGHAAPLAWLLSSDIVYIASSFTVKDAGKVTCASDPTIDNFVRFAGCRTIHDGYEFTRQDKLRNITEHVRIQNKSIELRVCYQSSGGKNCCKCEKCYRTIAGILAEGHDPNEFGLTYQKKDGSEMRRFLKYKLKMNRVAVAFWSDIQQRFSQNNCVVKERPELEWILNVDFERINDNSVKKAYLVYRKCINFIRIYINLFRRCASKIKKTIFK